MKLGEVLLNLGRPIAFYPGLAKVIGIKESIFLQQLIYWTGKGKDPDGWIYKTADEWEDETCLSKKEQVRVRNNLKDLGLIEEQHKRLDHMMFYRVVINRLEMLQFNGDGFSRSDQRAFREVTKGDSGELPKVTSSNIGAETTAQTTTETTKYKVNGKKQPTVEGTKSKDFIAKFCDAFKARFHDQYQVTGKDAGQVKLFFKHHPEKTADELMATVQTCWVENNPFYRLSCLAQINQWHNTVKVKLGPARPVELDLEYEELYERTRIERGHDF